MVRIRKHDGTTIEFDQDKLELSLIKSRVLASDIIQVIESVAERIRDGTEAAYIEGLVVGELYHLDPAAARRYEASLPLVLA